MESSKSGLIRAIAVFKFAKAVSLVGVGIAALKLVHSGGYDALGHWVARIGLDPGAHYVDVAIGRIASVPPQRLKDVGLGSFLYAALFLTEGTGLWLGKRWAEWFTVIITGSLVPLEVYEICRHPTALKVLLTIINVAVVAYLVARLRKQPASL